MGSGKGFERGEGENTDWKYSNDMDGLSGRIFDSNVDWYGMAGRREEML
jgi:hypothetical protein